VLGVFDLTGKVAVVTGSTKGLGRAMAEGLAQAGAEVVVCSRKQELCERVADEIAAATGRKTLGLACHVGDWEAVPAFVDAVVARFGRIDVLVNNAGINPGWVPVAELTLEYWRKVHSVNLEGPLRMSQCVAARMRETGGGSIINVASMAAYSAGPGNAAYGSSKAALLNLTNTMAAEWAPYRIRVNTLSPGPMVSTMSDAARRADPEWEGRAAAATLLKRMGATAEVIGPVVYLASDASSFVTAEDHVLAGGMR
jgi:NAD(P)-dependent dehydrogenase (short-subunit alcohol dehydrogenase family)